MLRSSCATPFVELAAAKPPWRKGRGSPGLAVVLRWTLMVDGSSQDTTRQDGHSSSLTIIRFNNKKLYDTVPVYYPSTTLPTCWVLVVLAITGKNRLMGDQGFLGHKCDIPAQADLASCSGRDEPRPSGDAFQLARAVAAASKSMLKSREEPGSILVFPFSNAFVLHRPSSIWHRSPCD